MKRALPILLLLTLATVAKAQPQSVLVAAANTITAANACNTAKTQSHSTMMDALYAYQVALEGRQTCSDPYFLDLGDGLLLQGNILFFDAGGPSWKSENAEALAWYTGQTGAVALHAAALAEWNLQIPDWPSVESLLVLAKIRYNNAKGHFDASVVFGNQAKAKWIAAAAAYSLGQIPNGPGPYKPITFSLPIFEGYPGIGGDELANFDLVPGVNHGEGPPAPPEP